MSIYLLPTEILIEILKCCQIQDIPNMSRTCKRWNEICQSEVLWAFRCLKDYNVTCKGRNFSTYKELYTILLHKYGHLIGTYKFKFFSYGGLLEIDFHDCLNVWYYKQIIRNERKTLERRLMFKIEKDPQENKINILCCSLTENPHKGILIKSQAGRRYILKCGDKDAFHEGLLRQGNHLVYRTVISSGCELFPIYIQNVRDVPKSLIKENGELADHLVTPGLYQVINKYYDNEVILLTYKEAFKIDGLLMMSGTFYGGEIVLKVNLCDIDKVPELGIDSIFDTLLLQVECELPKSHKKIFETKFRYVCKAFSMEVSSSSYLPAYFLVFDLDHFAVYNEILNNFKFFERINQPFNKKRGFCIYAN